jgi:translation initiation factor 3 subunit D
MGNCWGVLRAIVDLALKQGDGKYVLLKDPNKPLLSLYQVPLTTFEDVEESEGEMEEVDEDDE